MFWSRAREHLDFMQKLSKATLDGVAVLAGPVCNAASVDITDGQSLGCLDNPMKLVTSASSSAVSCIRKCSKLLSNFCLVLCVDL